MKKGISLAVLVVTIIVLVILTAATVATITGENGVIDEAREATSDAKRQNAEDKLYMELSAAQIRAAKEKIDLYTYLTTHATEYAGTVLELQSGSTSTNMKFLVDGYTIVTDGNGAILKENASTSNHNGIQSVSVLISIDEELLTIDEEEFEDYIIQVEPEETDSLGAIDIMLNEAEYLRLDIKLLSPVKPSDIIIAKYSDGRTEEHIVAEDNTIQITVDEDTTLELSLKK